MKEKTRKAGGASQSLQTRALIANSMLVGCSVLCLTILFLVTQRAAFQRQLRLRAESLAEFLASQSEFALLVGNRAELERTAGTAVAGEDVAYVVIADGDGKVLAKVRRLALPHGAIPEGVESSGEGTSIWRQPGAEAFVDVRRPVMAPESSSVMDWVSKQSAARRLGTVRIGFSMAKQEALFRETVKYGVGVALLSLALILGVHYLQFRRLLEPLKGLAGFAGQVGKGDLSQRAPVGRWDEVGQLALAFNQMVDQLEMSRQEMLFLLQEAQNASRLKSEFLANMSHEIRTPMNGVLGMMHLALNTELSAEQRDYLETAHHSAQSLLALLNDILDLSKIEAGRMELDRVEFSLRRFLEDSLRTVRPLAQQKDLELQCAVESGVPSTLIGDPARLRQVVINLVGNAIKFTDAGQVTLSVMVESAQRGQTLLHFEVRDTGIGIPAEHQKTIFDAFRQVDGSNTRRHGGAGLGLAICARLMGLMGGRIWVESEPGRGSTFHFVAPFDLAQRRMESIGVQLAPAEDLSRMTRAVSGPANGRSLRVLLAEDNGASQKLETRLVQMIGHTVRVASNGWEVLEALEQEDFDLILMDVQMPDMDGLETTAAIRKREEGTGRHIPILALTAYAMKGDRERCLAAGMDGYVAKPVDPAALAEEMERVGARRV